MSIAQFSWFKTFCIALLDTKPTFTTFQGEVGKPLFIHQNAFRNSCFISGYKCIDFSLYFIFHNPMSYLLNGPFKESTS